MNRRPIYRQKAVSPNFPLSLYLHKNLILFFEIKTPTICLQATTDPKKKKRKKEEVSFSFFIVFNRLTVVYVSYCGLTQGISPEICILCVRVIINKRSFEPFSCVCVFGSTFFARQTGQANPRYFQYQTFFFSMVILFKSFVNFFKHFSAHTLRKLQTEN